MFRTVSTLALLPTVLLAGCGYTTQGLYPPDIRTVAVPVFASKLLRRDVEIQLTQEVVQAIEAETPFKVVDGPHADTELRCTILEFYKTGIGEDVLDRPLGGNMNLTVTVEWIDNRTGDTLTNLGQPVVIRANGVYNIELAQSQATATLDVTQQVAQRIAHMMEAPW